MKKILYSILTLSAVFCTMSCQKEVADPSSSNELFELKASLEETKVSYIETGEGKNIKFQPSWQVGDVVVGLKGNTTPIKFTVKKVDERGVATLSTETEFHVGDVMSLIYAPSATEPTGIVDGKIPVDVAVMSDDPSKISPIMMAQGPIVEGETYLDFSNKMAIIAIKSVTGLEKGTKVNRMVILGTRTYSTAQVDLLKQEVTGLFFGDLRTNITENNNIVDGKFEHTVYASIIPATTSIDIYTVTDQEIYKATIDSREIKASHYYYTSNRASVPASDVYQTGANEYCLFSPANLTYVINGDDGTGATVANRWKFAPHQVDFIGDAAVSTNANLKNNAGLTSGTLDLFSWSNASDTYRLTLNVYKGHPQSGELYDWGKGLIAKYIKNNDGSQEFVGYWVPDFWHTPTSARWEYMLMKRPGNRYCYCAISDVANKYGVVVFQQLKASETGWNKVNAVFGEGNNPTFNDNSRTKAFFDSDEYIFLPATGVRYLGSDTPTNQALVRRAAQDLLYWASGTTSLHPSVHVNCGPAINMTWAEIHMDHLSGAGDGIAVRMIHVI